MKSLWEQAETLRDRAFLRYMDGYRGSWSSFSYIPSTATLAERMRLLYRDPGMRKELSQIPISVEGRPRGRVKLPPNGIEATLHQALQDLADILAVEAEDAFEAEYYPRLPDVDVSPRHVKRVMAALQREIDGEANARQRMSLRFSDLPWQRQCALAERRRYWFAAFGITPRAWKRGTWSLWRVKKIPFPEEVKARIK